ncbi:glucose-1-phosphate adenylyltransferase [Escherichia coli]|uniref:Glucose-1-phosphate adenylyltransferase n=1 Tax=Escherichia coli TaxID=562 RepID=A0A2X1MUY7_ECOLX|nr:glucose-1-phosphate adenylyltransferase [Escherichia coli]
MVSLEKNDHLMLARQLPLKSVALDTGGRTWYPPEGFNQ